MTHDQAVKNQAVKDQAVKDQAVNLINAVKKLGFYPKERKAKDEDGQKECKLAHNIRMAHTKKLFTPAQLTELEELKQNLVHPRDRATSATLLAAAQEPPNAMEGFAGDSENRLEQDLLLLANGYRTRDLQRRLQKYQNFIADADTSNTEFAQKYKERILNAAAAPQGPGTYVPGTDIQGDELRTFSANPIISGPLVCQLCDADFINQKSFTEHKKRCHSGECEYRKRVLFLMQEQGCRPITGQEKRIMVQNFAHFQQYCYPGTKGNYYGEGVEVPRCEAASPLVWAGEGITR